jgi:tight adherence protein B
LSLTLARVRKTRLDLSRRIGLVGHDGGKKALVGTVEMTVAGESGWRLVLGTHVRGFCSWRLPRTWGMTAGGITLIVIGLCGAVAAWSATHLGLHLSGLFVVPLTLLAALWAPRAWLKHQQGGADAKFMAVFPDTIDMVIRMLRAGLPITSAVRAVGQEALPPVNEVFTNLADKMAIGITFEDALATAGERIGLPDFRFFAVAISLQRATGGNLATTLDILSDLMRKRRAARLKAKATTGEVRMSAYVLGGIPFFIIGGLLIMAPAYLAPLLTDPRGRVLVAVATGSLLTGFIIIGRMMRSVTGDA